MRAIGYFRPKEGPKYVEAFKEAFLDYCDRHVHQPVETYYDYIGSGRDHSPNFRAMVEHMRRSASGYLVVVPDATHLGSDLETVARAVVELEALDAKVTCDDDDMPDPLQNSFQRLAVKGVSRTRSSRIQASMRRRAMQGLGLGKPPYGYRIGLKGTLEVVPNEVPVVELIFRLRTKEELGVRLIARHLNERGIPTRRGGKWNMVTIRDILRNSTYIGTYRRFGMSVPKSHEAIIPPQVFRAAQEVTRARRPIGRVVNAQPFLLSGLVVCGYCDNKMMGVTRRQSWKRKDGRRGRGVYRYYQCQSRNNQSLCGYHTWRAARLEGAAMGQLKQALRYRELEARLDPEAAKSRRDEVKAAFDARVQNAERRFLQSMRQAAMGKLTTVRLGEYLDDLDSVRNAAKNADKPLDVDKTLENWDSLEMEDQQRFLNEHVSRIIVKDDSVDVAV